ncbi:MAG: inorganic phosphate transporter [Gammaproteobacteria bacterium]|uniref:Phosphate transporter n=1 Tax=Candidatus Thiopontia autotrophica TaxID=2841688 RepID=A0A8J6P0I1_9GAMM|nr:inorganic phosphate transporter [Candidatus Thiopontia autotrophica]
MDYSSTYLILVAIFGLFMAWGIGANDVANAIGTSVGSRALTLKQAVVVAAIFEFLGAYLAGGEVTKTIRKGIIDSNMLQSMPNGAEILIFGMLAALLAAAIWLLVASYFGWPVSTTHSIVGAIVGFAAVGIGVDAVQWSKVGSIIMSWFGAPMLAALLSFTIFRSVQKLILDTDKPFENAKRFVPMYIFLTGFVISLVTIVKGLKHVGLHFTTGTSFQLAVLAGVVIMAIGIFFIRRIEVDEEADKDFHFANVEKVFAVLMVVTASAMAFAHGSNDVANAVGPIAAVVGVVQSGTIETKSIMPSWVLLLGGIGIVIGLLTYGARVMATIGQKITELTPSRGFAAELAAASTVVIASGTGLPVSTTQTLVGAVLGVGFARGIAALDMGTIRTIFMSWVVTLPAGALLSILFFFFLKGVFL